MRRRGFRLRFLHAFLFGLLPVVSLLAHNIDGAPVLHALRPGLVVLFFTIVLLALSLRLTRDWERAALLTSLFLLLFFSYGHVYFGLVTEGTLGLFQGMGLVGRHPALVLAWGSIFAVGAFAIHRARTLRPVMTQAFLVMGLVAVAFPLGQILLHEVQLSRPWDWPARDTPAAGSDTRDNPDIYLIVLDGYGRSDVLLDIYGYDNSEFIDGLRDRGFFIATEARSNYPQTGLSLASSLNMSYLDFLSEHPGSTSADRTPLARLIRWSLLREFLEGRGYAIVGLSTGYRVTELENADVYFRAPIDALTTLERLLLETSGAAIVQDLLVALGRPPLLPGYQAHRERVLYEFEALKSAASLPGPKFVMAHFLVPHPPYVFDKDGTEPTHRYPFTLMDGSAFLGTQAEYLRGYRGQITFVDHVVLDVLSSILNSSESPPVIVLMGDHGPGSRLVWDSAEQTDLHERTAILNAYLLPGVPHEVLHAAMTPVNSFRLVLDSYFGTRLGLLPDQSYFATWDRPYSFIPVE